VTPYYFTFHAFSKSRWNGRPLIAVLKKEFDFVPPDYWVVPFIICNN
jgi:hypothetical protein